MIDKTGLTGKYDFTFRFSCESCLFGAANGTLSGPPNRTDAPDGVPNIFVALQKQPGLKLAKIKDVIVVDHVDKTPTANRKRDHLRAHPAPESHLDYLRLKLRQASCGPTGEPTKIYAF